MGVGLGGWIKPSALKRERPGGTWWQQLPRQAVLHLYNQSRDVGPQCLATNYTCGSFRTGVGWYPHGQHLAHSGSLLREL